MDQPEDAGSVVTQGGVKARIDPVLVGRLRDDPTQTNTIDLWVTGDNLRKGAALNAIQMAEILVARG